MVMVNHMYGLLARCFWEYLLFFLLHALINQSLNIQRVRPCAGRRVLGETGPKAPDQNVEQIRTSVAKWTLLQSALFWSQDFTRTNENRLRQKMAGKASAFHS